MFVTIRELAAISTIASMVILPMAVTASADTVKPAKLDAVMVDKTVTFGISKNNELLSKNKKFAFGNDDLPYSGPLEAFYINGIN